MILYDVKCTAATHVVVRNSLARGSGKWVAPPAPIMLLTIRRPTFDTSPETTSVLRWTWASDAGIGPPTKFMVCTDRWLTSTMSDNSKQMTSNQFEWTLAIEWRVPSSGLNDLSEKLPIDLENYLWLFMYRTWIEVSHINRKDWLMIHVLYTKRFIRSVLCRLQLTRYLNACRDAHCCANVPIFFIAQCMNTSDVSDVNQRRLVGVRAPPPNSRTSEVRSRLICFAVDCS